MTTKPDSFVGLRLDSLLGRLLPKRHMRLWRRAQEVASLLAETWVFRRIGIFRHGRSIRKRNEPLPSRRSPYRRHGSNHQGATPVNPYSYVIEQDAETGDYVHKIKFPTGFSHDLSCIMFDAVNNLRACLDHLTYAIALQHRGDNGHFAYFPFASDLLHWPAKIKGYEKELPSDIRTFFEGFKPYKGGNDILWAVNYVANVKKHALLVPVWYGGTKIIIPAGTAIPNFSVTPFERAKKDEIEIYRSSDPPDRQPNFQITYSVIIDHPEEIIQGQPPVALLNAMRCEVERVLLGTDAECRRIGLIP